MAKILIFTEIHNQQLKSVTLEILGKLSGHEANVASFQKLSDENIKQLKKFGANEIYHLNGTGLDQYSPEGYANALTDFLKKCNHDFVFAGATSVGKDFLPRTAANFMAGMASDIIGFRFEGEKLTGTRPLFSGKCLADFEIVGPRPHFITVRPNALGMTEKLPAEGKAQLNETSVDSGVIRAKIAEVVKGASERPDLTEANIIVSGGRAMKNSENFKILFELADVMGATVGASRAAVDSGFASPSMQVGQTGKTVSPSLYIACGISGAIQHLAGMRTSKVIVAINTDPDAPIFSKADYGIVGDLFSLVPLFTQELKKFLNT